MHRPTIGLIALVLFAVGFYTREQPDGTLSAACLRVGVVMAILWFAHPQMKHVPRWLIIAGGASLFVIMRWPKLLVLALPVAILLWFLRPRAPRMGRGPANRRA